MDKYKKIVIDELKRHDLTINDLTKEEFEDMLAEAEERGNNADVFGGWFDIPSPLEAIKLKKLMSDK